MIAKRKQGSRQYTKVEAPSESHITTKADLESKRRAALERLETPQQRPTERLGSPRLKRAPDTRAGRRRSYIDGVDDFELELLKHGLNMEDVLRASREYDAGTNDKYRRLAHAVFHWWIGLPVSPRKVAWVDPTSGFTLKNLPKFSTREGQELLSKGLAGARWVYNRVHLIEARMWAKKMLAMSPGDRLAEPIQLGDERLADIK